MLSDDLQENQPRKINFKVSPYLGSLYETFLDLNEKWTLRFRAEAFNVLNHPNFNSPIAGGVVFDSSDLIRTKEEFLKRGSACLSVHEFKCNVEAFP